jgi:hypothetical protein
LHNRCTKWPKIFPNHIKGFYKHGVVLVHHPEDKLV